MYGVILHEILASKDIFGDGVFCVGHIFESNILLRGDGHTGDWRDEHTGGGTRHKEANKQKHQEYSIYLYFQLQTNNSNKFYSRLLKTFLYIPISS